MTGVGPTPISITGGSLTFIPPDETATAARRGPNREVVGTEETAELAVFYSFRNPSSYSAILVTAVICPLTRRYGGGVFTLREI